MTPGRLIAIQLSLVLVAVTGSAGDERALTKEDFIAGIADQVFQCSFTSYPRVRFFGDRIEILGEKDEVSRTVKDTKVIEPGVIINSLLRGGSIWFVFPDRLDTFCVANMNDVYPIEFEDKEFRLEKWPEQNAPAMTVELTDHPRWAKLRIEREKVTPVLSNGDEGEPFPIVRFNDYSLWALYKTPGLKTGVSHILLSRDGQRGWWMEGDQLGSGAKTFRNRDATPRRKSILDPSGFARRSNQFGWYLLKMGKMDEAFVQEKYSEYYLNESYGPESKQAIDGLRVMGELRASALRYEKAPYWLEKAAKLARTTFKDQPETVREYEVALAKSQVEAGEYEVALETLPEPPDFTAKFGEAAYNYVYIISEGSFGTGDYAKAATWQKVCVDRAREAGNGNWVINGMLGIISCHLARGDTDSAVTTLGEAIAFQEERRKNAEPGTEFETHLLALACVALEQWKPALHFSNEGNYQSPYFEFEEAIRLLALWNSGDRESAVKMADKIVKRFDGNLSGTIRSRDSSELFVAIIDVFSSPDSPEKVLAFRRVLSEQKELLKKRSLRNYLLLSAVAKADRLLD